MLKSLDDFAVRGERPWAAMGISGGVTFMMAGILLAMFVGTPAVIPEFLMVAGVVWCFFCAFRDAAQFEDRERIFADYLAGVDVTTLRLASTSLEFDDATRSCIIRFLNAQHPGWSLQHG